MRKRTLNRTRGVVFLLFLISLIGLSSVIFASIAKGPAETELKKMASNIHWLGHDSFRIDGDGVVIYYVGYILSVKGLSIYHAGDTDFIPEMQNLKVEK